jgi:8-oxo-dGTP pyrophosphatase MutT (NUDIX family)
MSTFPPPNPAATLVVFRRAADGGLPELLMIERSQQMRFAAGSAAFPGGRVDSADHDLARSGSPLLAGVLDDTDETAARIAALRETLEETGLLVGVNKPVTPAEVADARAHLAAEGALAPVLERRGWTLDLGALVPFARWCPNIERAFDTRFYLADIGTGAVEISVDNTENSRLFWASAEQTLVQAREGSVSLLFPTMRNLERLALRADFAGAAACAAAHPLVTISPSIVERDGVRLLTIPPGLGYPVTEVPLDTARRS